MAKNKNALTGNQTTTLIVETLAILANGIALDPADRASVDANISALNKSVETVSEAAETLAEA